MNFFTKKLTISMAVAALGIASLVAAESSHMGRHGRMAGVMTKLGLTDAQKTQAEAIFQNAHESAKPVMQQLRQERQAVEAAVKGGKSDQEIQQLAKAEGPEIAQLAAIRASARAKFYGLLTADQKQKLETLHQSFRANRPGRG